METALEYVLPDQRLLMNPFSNLNDPHEYRRRRIVWAIVQKPDRDVSLPESVRSLTIEMLEQHVKMVCFSSDDADVGSVSSSEVLKSSPMWAHYGDEHRGVALLLDEDRIRHRIESLGGFGHAGVFHEIEYADEYEKRGTLGAMMWAEEWEDDAASRIAQQYMDAITRHWRFKHRDWRYEREKRGIVINDTDPLYLDIGDALRGVVLGDRVSDDAAELVLERLPVGTAAFRLEYQPGQYRYRLEELEAHAGND